MRLPFGWSLTKATPPGASAIAENRGAWRRIFEPFAGAWQRNEDAWELDTVLAHHAVYACITLIAQDVGKLRPRLVEKDADGIWSEVESAAFSPVLRKPNRYQNHIQFKEWWITSKLLRGNAYVLKYRDARGIVTGMYLLDPNRVTVLVAPDGSVYYQLSQDDLSGLRQATVTVPASEIIHDRMNCLFHPLVGVSPIFACGSAANIGLRIQSNSANFFGKGSNPSGILTAPNEVTQEDAGRLADEWNRNFTGANAGRVAVLGDGMKFEPMRMTAVDSQTIEHLKWSAETVCSTFHMPPFKIGLGNMPTYQNGEILNGIYYSDCLQSHIESMELCLDEGLGVGEGVKTGGRIYGVDLDLDGLLRMDDQTLVKTLTEGVKGSIMTPNEARRRQHLKPLPGGDTIYMQQQNYSLAALDERDKQGPLLDPGPNPGGAVLALPPARDDEDDEAPEEETRAFFDNRVIEKRAA